MERQDLVAMEMEMDRRAKADEDFEDNVQSRINLFRADSQERFIEEWIADPVAELAMLYREIALNWHDEVEIGRRLKTILKNRYRAVAEHFEDHDR